MRVLIQFVIGIVVFAIIGFIVVDSAISQQPTQMPRQMLAPEGRMTTVFVDATTIDIGPRITQATPWLGNVGNRVLTMFSGCRVQILNATLIDPKNPALGSHPNITGNGVTEIQISDAGIYLIYRVDNSLLLSATSTPPPTTGPPITGGCVVMGQTIGGPPTERPLFRWEAYVTPGVSGALITRWRHDRTFYWLEPPGYSPAQSF